MGQAKHYLTNARISTNALIFYWRIRGALAYSRCNFVQLPRSIQSLIDEFAKLPGIGPKTASRLVFYLLTKPAQDLTNLSHAVATLKQSIRECRHCYTLTDSESCSICRDPTRDQSTIMVVAKPLDVIAMEKTGFSGRYFVIGGVISPLDGIGPADLRIDQLVNAIDQLPNIKEVILATDPSLEGEATAYYIAKEIEKRQNKNRLVKINITRLARGLPIGSELEYADELTLTRALEGRKEY